MLKDIENIRKLMYFRYCRELDQYSPQKDPSEQKAYAVAQEYISRDCFNWIDITDNNEICGFLITGNDLEYVHGKGLYICEAYVDPDKRNRGLMTKAVRKALNKVRNQFIYMEIFNENKRAIKFWKERMKEINAILIGTSPGLEYKELSEYIYLKQ